MPTSKDAQSSVARAGAAELPEESRRLTPEEHRQRHVELHRALDELLADYILHHREQRQILTMPLIDLLNWAYLQTKSPDELPHD